MGKETIDKEEGLRGAGWVSHPDGDPQVALAPLGGGDIQPPRVSH